MVYCKYIGFRRAAILLIVSLFFSGCFSSRILPTHHETSSFQSFEVVAMEPPPLIVTERFINPGFTGAYGHGAGVLVLVYGVVAIIKTPNDYHESIMASREYQDLLSHKDIWIPTVILANKALEILEFGGKLDKRTGRIIGRARKSGMLEVGSANDLFLNDALGFKDAFSTLGFRLLNECLVDMTLVHYKI